MRKFPFLEFSRTRHRVIATFFLSFIVARHKARAVLAAEQQTANVADKP
jgi:hypothetical protein